MPHKRTRSVAAGTTCSVLDCDRPTRCVGLCSRHYDQQRRREECPGCGQPMRRGSSRCSGCYLAEWLDYPTDKICPRCGETKPVDEGFGWRTDGRGNRKPRSACKACESAAQVERVRARPPERKREAADRRKERERERAAENPLAHLRRSVAASARGKGLDVAEVLARFDEVGNRCEACGEGCDMSKRGRVQVDHDHESGAFRGLLCRRCNATAGMANDNPVVLATIVGYLSRKYGIGPECRKK